MQRADVVLGALRKHAVDKDFLFVRLYRHLYNEGLYPRAAQGSVALSQLVAELRSERYPASRSPVTTPGDRWLEQAVMGLLEAVYPGCDGEESAAHLAGMLPVGPVSWAMGYSLARGLGGLDWSSIVRVLRRRIADGRLLELLCHLYPRPERAPRLRPVLERIYARAVAEDYVPVHPTTWHRRWRTQGLLLGPGEARLERERDALTLYWQGWGLESVELTPAVPLAEQALSWGGYSLQLQGERCIFLVPGNVWRQQVRPFLRQGRPAARRDRLFLPVSRIVQLYAEELRAAVEGYLPAKNARARARDFHYFHGQSLLKTLAHKEGRSLREVAGRYRVQTTAGERGIGCPLGDQLIFYPARIGHVFAAWLESRVH